MFEIEYRNLLNKCLSGEARGITRTGVTYSTFGEFIKVDLKKGFPATLGKRLAWKSVVSELLWFLSGKTDIESLQKYNNSDGWTIWTDDMERWHQSSTPQDVPYGDCGDLYGKQWRNYNGVDQITNLIEGLKNDPTGRRHIVMAWNPSAIAAGKMCLPPCHIGFQCYIDNSNDLHLQWWQRSGDGFLGVPFNFASYALLVHLLAKWVGCGVGGLSVCFGDVHVYGSHVNAVKEYLDTDFIELSHPDILLPPGTDDLSSTLQLTSNDFKNALVGYDVKNVIKAPLSVGV
jgi:thymidylate synthase